MKVLIQVTGTYNNKLLSLKYGLLTVFCKIEAYGTIFQ